MGTRRFVPMEALWSMPVEVPVSLLLQDDDLGWSCGQLALDADGAVMHADDLAAQSRVVCDYIDLIASRAALASADVRRILLYHVHTTAGGVAELESSFRDRFGPNVLLDLVAVPHFYYPGVLLECDAFFDAGPMESHDSSSVQIRAGDELAWVSVESIDDIRSALDALGAALEGAGWPGSPV